MLIEGVRHVKMFGEKILVRAQVHTLGGFSAHAGQTDLLSWFQPLAATKPKVFLTHGEDGPRKALAERIRSHHGITPVLPGIGQTVEG
jgi:metallo-beta-lactamase family protein